MSANRRNRARTQAIMRGMDSVSKCRIAREECVKAAASIRTVFLTLGDIENESREMNGILESLTFEGSDEIQALPVAREGGERRMRRAA